MLLKQTVLVTCVNTNMYVKAWLIVGTWLCRLQKQGMRVLVEKPVHRTEFPEFDAFDAEKDGTIAPPLRKCITFALCHLRTLLCFVQIKLSPTSTLVMQSSPILSRTPSLSFPQNTNSALLLEACSWKSCSWKHSSLACRKLPETPVGGTQTYQCHCFLNLLFSMHDAGCEHPPGLCMSEKKSSTYSAKPLYWITPSHFSTQS